MKTSLEDISSVKKKLIIEIESKEIDGKINAAYRDLGQRDFFKQVLLQIGKLVAGYYRRLKDLLEPADGVEFIVDRSLTDDDEDDDDEEEEEEDDDDDEEDDDLKHPWL